MPFDYKKEYKDLYLPKTQPSIIEVPKINYLVVRGSGNPNAEDSEYKQSIGLLYAIAFTIKMSKKGAHQLAGYFDYVVPPLEGLWWQESQNQSNNSQNPPANTIDYTRKDDFEFISIMRLPEFVTKVDFDWAIAEATRKKQQDFSKVEFLEYEEGECAQCMHIGSYDEEPETLAKLHQFIAEQGYEVDIHNPRYHHEIYLSDPRRTAPEKCKTVLRIPIKLAKKS